MFKRRRIKAVETELAALKPELDRLKANVAELNTVLSRGSEAVVETEIVTLKTELDRLKSDVAEVKQTLSRVLGENHGLREENDWLTQLTGIAPALPTQRHQYPHYAATDEA